MFNNPTEVLKQSVILYQVTDLAPKENFCIQIELRRPSVITLMGHDFPVPGEYLYLVHPDNEQEFLKVAKAAGLDARLLSTPAPATGREQEPSDDNAQ